MTASLVRLPRRAALVCPSSVSAKRRFADCRNREWRGRGAGETPAPPNLHRIAGGRPECEHRGRGDHRLGAWVVTALTLGLRPDEFSGLEWGDVNLDDGVVIVHKSLAWNGNDPYLKTTKTKRPRTLDHPE